MSIDVPHPYGPDAWIVGEIFMRHYFTTFDRGEGNDGRRPRVCVSPMRPNPDPTKVRELSGDAVLAMKFQVGAHRRITWSRERRPHIFLQQERLTQKFVSLLLTSGIAMCPPLVVDVP